MNLMTTGDGSDDPKKGRKQCIIEDLAVIEDEMSLWGQEPPEQIEAELEEYKEYRADRDRIVGKAIRACLSDHPFVQAWLSEKRSFGDWVDLRRFRAGLEPGGHSQHWHRPAATGLRPEAKLRAGPCRCLRGDTTRVTPA